MYLSWRLCEKEEDGGEPCEAQFKISPPPLLPPPHYFFTPVPQPLLPPHPPSVCPWSHTHKHTHTQAQRERERERIYRERERERERLRERDRDRVVNQEAMSGTEVPWVLCARSGDRRRRHRCFSHLMAARSWPSRHTARPLAPPPPPCPAASCSVYLITLCGERRYPLRSWKTNSRLAKWIAGGCFI